MASRVSFSDEVLPKGPGTGSPSHIWSHERRPCVCRELSPFVSPLTPVVLITVMVRQK